jgi:hypothetical protein
MGAKRTRDREFDYMDGAVRELGNFGIGKFRNLLKSVTVYSFEDSHISNNASTLDKFPNFEIPKFQNYSGYAKLLASHPCFYSDRNDFTGFDNAAFID